MKFSVRNDIRDDLMGARSEESLKMSTQRVQRAFTKPIHKRGPLVDAVHQKNGLRFFLLLLQQIYAVQANKKNDNKTKNYCI